MIIPTSARFFWKSFFSQILYMNNINYIVWAATCSIKMAPSTVAHGCLEIVGRHSKYTLVSLQTNKNKRTILGNFLMDNGCFNCVTYALRCWAGWRRKMSLQTNYKLQTLQSRKKKLKSENVLCLKISISICKLSPNC